jgi:CMP-N-acetylneuraminic acid synthetase
MNEPELIALLPMRHHSQRVPGKNYRPLAGKPLFHHVLETLLGCPEIDRVVVDTDSVPIISDLERNYARAAVLVRPRRLCGDTVSMNDILLYDTERFPARLYLQTHATNPLLGRETIRRALRVFRAAQGERDSLFSVTRRQIRIWDAAGRPLNHDPQLLIQTQDLPPFYEENSCLYLFTRENLAARGTRIGERPLMFEIEGREAWDIDTELDFQVAEGLAAGSRSAAEREQG